MCTAIVLLIKSLFGGIFIAVAIMVCLSSLITQQQNTKILVIELHKPQDHNVSHNVSHTDCDDLP